MTNNVWLLSNVYGKLDEENILIKEIIKWRFDEKTEEEFRKIGIDKENIQLPLIGSRSQKYQLMSPEGLILPYSKMVAKGCAIRNNFFSLLNNFKIDDDDFVIYFDGDGQINHNQIFKIIVALKENKFVLCNRSSKKGISDERYLVEKFENSFIEDSYSVSLPDAQCGCWGLKGNHLKTIYSLLSAEGFEIELDLIICSLEVGVKPHFVDIELIEVKNDDTTYKTEDNVRKLVYLMKKFNIKTSDLIDKTQIFASRFKPLPLSYTQLFPTLESHFDKFTQKQ